MKILNFLVSAILFYLGTHAAAQSRFTEDYMAGCQKCFSKNETEFLKMCSDNLDKQNLANYGKNITALSIFYAGEKDAPQYIDAPLIIDTNQGLKNYLKTNARMLGICDLSKDSDPAKCLEELLDKTNVGGIIRTSVFSYHNICSTIKLGQPGDLVTNGYEAVILDKSHTMLDKVAEREGVPKEEVYKKFNDVLGKAVKQIEEQSLNYKYAEKIESCMRDKIENYTKNFLQTSLEHGYKQFLIVDSDKKKQLCSELSDRLVSFFLDMRLPEYFYQKMKDTIVNSALIKACGINDLYFPRSNKSNPDNKYSGSENICDYSSKPSSSNQDANQNNTKDASKR